MEANVLPGADAETSDALRRPAIRRETEACLRRSGYLALRALTCEARDGVVRLHGRLPTYYLKQVAQSVASGVAGVRRVVNHIEVIAPAGRAPIGGDRAMKPTGMPV